MSDHIPRPRLNRHRLYSLFHRPPRASRMSSSSTNPSPSSSSTMPPKIVTTFLYDAEHDLYLTTNVPVGFTTPGMIRTQDPGLSETWILEYRNKDYFTGKPYYTIRSASPLVHSIAFPTLTTRCAAGNNTPCLEPFDVNRPFYWLFDQVIEPQGGFIDMSSSIQAPSGLPFAGTFVSVHCDPHQKPCMQSTRFLWQCTNHRG